MKEILLMASVPGIMAYGFWMLLGNLAKIGGM